MQETKQLKLCPQCNTMKNFHSSWNMCATCFNETKGAMSKLQETKR